MTLTTLGQRLDRLGRGLENLFLTGSLLAMIGLAVAQIVLRNTGVGSFVWGDELLRLLVLWLALIGAIAASRDDHHIRIDVLSRFVPRRVRLALRVIVDLFTSAVCGVIAWHAVRFVASTHEFGDLALGALPLWYFQAILPIGFALVCYRYAWWSVAHARQLVTVSATD